VEVDRRRLVQRIHHIRAELKEIDRTRGVQRQGRDRGRHREVTLVGYTNAGKSSMLNALTNAGGWWKIASLRPWIRVLDNVNFPR